MVDLRSHGLSPRGSVYARLAPAEFLEHALARREGLLADSGALVAYTGAQTGRSPRDKYVVADPQFTDQIDWGSVNQRMEPASFEKLLAKVRDHLQTRDLFVFDGWACADPAHRLAVRVVAERAWHAMFGQCLLRRPSPSELNGFQPRLTILAAPGLLLDPKADGTRSEVCIALNLATGQVLIAGTHYAGEIKKSVFTYLNGLLPQHGVFPMHCSANLGRAGDTALLFGLSGTGKTTLSADPERRLIGDDEHGWSDDGIFNFEGGCYAKTIRLSPKGEPQIYAALRFGSILENVILDPRTRRPDFDDERLTENTRAAYPLDYIPGAELSGRGGHPRHVLFLTCDAFGVLPPLSKLTPAQALYHFLSGYTAKVAGTEAGVSEPQATFSTCFAAPFLPLPPVRYAQMLHEKLNKHKAQVWLVNTGWTAGPFGKGHRFPLVHTRRLVSAVLNNELEKTAFTPDPVFGVLVPNACPGVPAELLQPRSTWKDQSEYDRMAHQLAKLFRENFEKYAVKVSAEVKAAGPKVE
ncbi:MAG: phosphoenolpyruvate carboxykinase (ATP) [Planctomycetes bacterium]|nr:phosphoenolpyruvate carboxykinase (ATP) [Planctomycetota bacterium]